MRRARRAFTMLEMIFVIVIMSVISTMTFGMIAQFYEAFIQKEAAGQLETETKVLVEQIAAHLQNAIKESVVVLKSDNSCDDHISSAKFYTSTYATLPGIAWVGENVEGRLGVWGTTQYMPGWSGDVNLSNSDTTQIVTLGSSLSDADTIIGDLSGQVNPLSTANFAAINFVGDGTITGACDEFIRTGATLMHPVVSVDTTNSKINFSSPAPATFTTVKEHYRLAWSAYAIVFNRNSKGELELVYNFRPWNGDTVASAIADTTTAKITDLHSGKKYTSSNSYISAFAVKYETGLIRFNICVSKNINGYDAQVCKEKVVF
jgi:prepilin-type N-terminal cleavage/methylation domain-containing protein